MDILALVKEVMLISKGAGERIMEIYEREDLGVETKSDDSPVTLADKTSNAYIVAELEKLTPMIPIISEEIPEEDFETRSQYHYYWLVDPLDGTKEFINRNGDFTVNIALIEKNKPVLGVVFVPVQEKMYWAVEGQGAWEISRGVTNEFLQILLIFHKVVWRLRLLVRILIKKPPIILQDFHFHA